MPIGVGAHTHAYIPNTLVDAKGDIVVASASDTPAILSKGSDGTVLVSDSTTSTGLAWQPYGAQVVAGKNKLINGAFDIWQRGTSFSVSGSYMADRWNTDSDATFTTTRETFTPGAAPVPGYEATYFYRIAKNSGGSYANNRQRIEDVRTFAGQTVTLSFWAKANSAIAIQPYWIQGFGSGGSTSVGNSMGDATLTTSWARYSFTFAVPSISGKTIGTNHFVDLYVNRYLGSSAVTIDTWGVQLELGSIATPFTTATGTIQGELAACQRYYWRTNRESQGSSARITPYGIAQTTTAAEINFYLPTAMRTKPSSVDFANLRTYDGATLQAVTSVGIGDGSSTSINLGFTVASGLVQYRPTAVALNGDGYLGLSAEL